MDIATLDTGRLLLARLRPADADELVELLAPEHAASARVAFSRSASPGGPRRISGPWP